ncbi:MAG TPA: hypothetical protein PLS84_00390 [Salinivirgaceae bacterium]|mgnify:CR=1 FL=1|nr:hypothetical protein [Salinivirgaceae bacterium]
MSNKDKFEKVYERFLTPELTEKSIIFEALTDSELESKALKIIMDIMVDASENIKKIAKQLLEQGGITLLKRN